MVQEDKWGAREELQSAPPGLYPLAFPRQAPPPDLGLGKEGGAPMSSGIPFSGGLGPLGEGKIKSADLASSFSKQQ